jgi:Uma2 family endonuclease
MIMQAEEKKTYTPAEYLEFEVNLETRHKYINGEITPMTGGTPEHNETELIILEAVKALFR